MLWDSASGLWVGFLVILPTGSILSQNVAWQLAAIHSGNWLLKLTLIPVGVVAWPEPNSK